MLSLYEKVGDFAHNNCEVRRLRRAVNNIQKHKEYINRRREVMPDALCFADIKSIKNIGEQIAEQHSNRRSVRRNRAQLKYKSW